MINVYGKPDCTWCVASKKLLDDRSISYNYYSVGEHVGIDYIIESFPGVKTVPIIQINGKYIGGYEELKAYLEETSGGSRNGLKGTSIIALCGIPRLQCCEKTGHA